MAIDEVRFKAVVDRIMDMKRELLGHASSKNERVAIASNLIFAGSLIYKEMGGSEMAAQQLYCVADRCATESAEQAERGRKRKQG